MRRVPAEWEPQRCVLMSFPHKDTDWHDPNNPKSLEEALSVHIRIAQAIAYKEPVYILCDDKKRISEMFCSTFNMIFLKIPTNDTWIRDYGYISVEENGEMKLLDFTFDGWGGKFDATLDNRVNSELYKTGLMGTTPMESIDFVLEGGAIENDGKGTVLTTTRCLCNPNRNGGLTKTQVEAKLQAYLGAKRVLWLDHGGLEGDDTDGHIDTLVRFVDEATIAYISCEDSDDTHYADLKAMEAQLRTFRQADGKPYRLVPLPMPEAIYDNQGNRLPATYANFLITNAALIYPTYGDKYNDKKAGEIFKSLFPSKEIIPVNCRKLIEQGGSLHCATMQVAR